MDTHTEVLIEICIRNDSYVCKGSLPRVPMKNYFQDLLGCLGLEPLPGFCVNDLCAVFVVEYIVHNRY